jgi:phage tail-like protein
MEANDTDIYPPLGFSFYVEILGDSQQSGAHPRMGFKEVSGISASMEVQSFAEGGENRFEHKLPGRVKYDSHLELKQGLVLKDSPFGAWCMNHFSKGLNMVNQQQGIQTKNIIVHLMDASTDTPVMSWAFARAYPVKWDVSGFNAAQSEMMIASLSLAYAYFFIVE